MLRTTRRMVGISVLAGGSIAVLAGWLTGFFGRVITGASRTWDRFLAWLQAPLGLDHLVAATTAILIPLIIIFVVILVLSDD